MQETLLRFLKRYQYEQNLHSYEMAEQFGVSNTHMSYMLRGNRSVNKDVAAFLMDHYPDMFNQNIHHVGLTGKTISKYQIPNISEKMMSCDIINEVNGKCSIGDVAIYHPEVSKDFNANDLVVIGNNVMRWKNCAKPAHAVVAIIRYE